MTRMIQRFLLEKHIPKKSLAKSLGISVKNMDKLFSSKIPPGLRYKINLPLITLYCKTKWK